MKKIFSALILLALCFTCLASCKEPDEDTVHTPPADLPSEDPASPDDDPPDVPDENDPFASAINAAEDWGVSTDTGRGIANGLILYEKMNTLANGSTVYFPEGVYELDLPLVIAGKKNIRIVGRNAVFLNTRATNTAASQSPSDDPTIPSSLKASTATSGMVWIEGAQNITVEGITFRYATPTSISGEVLAYNAAASCVDIKVTDGSLLTGQEYVMAINTFTADGIPDRTLEQYAATHFAVEKRSSTTLRLRGVNAQNLSVGTRVCLRTSLSSNYVFTIFNSSDLVFRDLTLNNSLNGGFLIEHRTVNATFERVRVQSHNPNALMSLNADAIHIAGLGGELVVSDCHFERAGDDFINVHGVAANPTSVSGNTVSFTLPWGADSRWVSRGDVIEFYHPDTFVCLGTATVTHISGTALTFDALPDGVDMRTVMSNRTLHPSVKITDTTAQYNRARAFLLQTDDITIERCTFLGTALAAILIAPDIDNWMEMSPADGVTIKDCSFTSCGTEAAGVIHFATDHDNLTAASAAPIHENILITGCTFSSSVPAVYAVSCRNLVFTNNAIAVTHDHICVFSSCAEVTHDDDLQDRIHTTD